MWQVFRTYFPTLSALPNFAASWHSLMDVFQLAATSNSVEVSAVRCLSTVPILLSTLIDITSVLYNH